MSEWTDAEDRINATRRLCQHLHQKENEEDRKKCKADPDFAKKLLAKFGGFQIEEDLPAGKKADDAIPKGTVVRVFELTEKGPRDKYVEILLPDPDKPFPDNPDRDIYVCTWRPWSA
jgi:hypothetical protein